jgi:hypothetical protein
LETETDVLMENGKTENVNENRLLQGSTRNILNIDLDSEQVYHSANSLEIFDEKNSTNSPFNLTNPVHSDHLFPPSPAFNNPEITKVFLFLYFLNLPTGCKEFWREKEESCKEIIHSLQEMLTKKREKNQFKQRRRKRTKT